MEDDDKARLADLASARLLLQLVADVPPPRLRDTWMPNVIELLNFVVAEVYEQGMWAGRYDRLTQGAEVEDKAMRDRFWESMTRTKEGRERRNTVTVVARMVVEAMAKLSEKDDPAEQHFVVFEDPHHPLREFRMVFHRRERR